MLTIGFIGAGNMAQAMMRGWSQVGEELTQVVYSRSSAQRVAQQIDGVEAKATIAEIVAAADMLVLAIPVGALPMVAEELKPLLATKPGMIVASVLGGVSLAKLQTLLGTQSLIVRTLPNVNVAVREGYTALAFDDTFDAETRGAVAGLFLALGRADELPEAQFGAVSALAGSGPAFVAGFVDALAQAGRDAGLKPETALTLAKQTILGTVQQLNAEQQEPRALAEQVMTPGGSTAAGWDVMQANNFDGIIAKTIQATMQKNAEAE